MVRSVLTPGELCSFGNESPKPFECESEWAARSEILEGNSSSSRLACSNTFSCACHWMYFFDKSNYWEPLPLSAWPLGRGRNSQTLETRRSQSMTHAGAGDTSQIYLVLIATRKWW